MLRLIERATLSPVALEDMVAHLRREDTEEDDHLIENYIMAAVETVEDYAGIALVDQTWDLLIDAFPPSTSNSGVIYLPRPPLLEIVGIFYRDSGGSEQTFTSYSWDAPRGDRPDQGRVYLPFSGAWPSTDGTLQSVRIRYRAGYLDASASP